MGSLNSRAFYDEDLAYIHDAGFSGLVEGWAPGLMGILQKAQIYDGLVVDLGCGSGVWADKLTAGGYRVMGVDISPAMVGISRNRVPSAEFHVGSIWTCSIPHCRAVTALGEVVCYRADRKARCSLPVLFKRVFESLDPGGLFIFDVAEVGLDRERAPGFAEGADWACLVRCEYDERRDRLTRHVTAFRQIGELYRRSQECHVLQLHRRKEVADQLRATGFQVRIVRRYGDFPLLRCRSGFIARKPDARRL